MYHNQFFRFFLFLIFVFLVNSIFSQNTPSKNPSLISFSEIKPYSFKVSFSKVEDAPYYLVLVSEKGIPIDKPQNKVTYFKGDKLYDSKVAYVGVDTVFVPSAIRTNHTYHYLVFAFSGQNGSENYQLTNPTYNKIVTSDLTIGNYYDEVSSSSPNFASQLHDLISPHKVISYYDYKNTILEKVELKDTSRGMRYIQCVYSKDRKVFSGSFDWTKLGYSREHTFAHSWMPSYPANNPEKPEYSDLHNLYPTNLDKANTVRNNYPFGEINGKVLYEYKEGRLGEMNGVTVYEPANSQKGNVARSIFYMLTAYYTTQNPWVLPSKQSEELLEKWHFQDLPDDYEKTRQEYIYDLQGNRNPYIDSVNFVCAIDFYKMIKSKKCISELKDKFYSNFIEVVYNLEKKTFIVESDLDLPIKIFSVDGMKIIEKRTNEEIPFLNLGIYIIELQVSNTIRVKKIIF
jgi:endonuclease I